MINTLEEYMNYWKVLSKQIDKYGYPVYTPEEIEERCLRKIDKDSPLIEEMKSKGLM